MYPLGIDPITTCPQCSILVEGSCVACRPTDKHPSCQNCSDGKYHPPWYENPTTNAIITAVVVSVISGLLVKSLSKSLKI